MINTTTANNRFETDGSPFRCAPGQPPLNRNVGRLMRNSIVAVLLLLSPVGFCADSDAFSGQWRVITGCPNGYGVAVNLIQNGKELTGEWYDMQFMEGNDTSVNTYGGHSGKLKGSVKGISVSVQICAWNEASECNFEDAGTLERADTRLIWINKAFDNPESVPPRGPRLTLSPGSADVGTWRCQE